MWTIIVSRTITLQPLKRPCRDENLVYARVSTRQKRETWRNTSGQENGTKLRQSSLPLQQDDHLTI